MKNNINKIMYSGITKVIAVVLLSACLGAAMYTALTKLPLMSDYNFEDSYTDSAAIHTEMYESTYTLMNAITNNADESGFQNMMSRRKADYYVEYGGNTYTNDASLSDFPQSGCYYYAIRKDGEWTAGGISTMYFSSKEAPSIDCRLYVRLTDSFAKSVENDWLAAKKNTADLFTALALIALAALIAFIYLLFTCGRHYDDSEIHFMAIDRCLIEVQAAAFLFSGIIIGYFTIWSLEAFWNMSGVELPISLLFAVLPLIPLSFVLSAVRIFKAGKLTEKSVICRFAKQIKSVTDKLILKKLSSAFIIIGFVYMLLAMLLAFASGNMLIFVIMLAAALIYVFKKLQSTDEILKGIMELRSGNTSYKIPQQTGVFAEIADAVNSIGDGIRNAVEIQLKSERMKSELITNVSHDLKTPLTSVINYSDLLCKEKLVPEKANEYAKIIREKSESLKKITSDLFDISKVQSGNAVIKTEEIDASLLMQQALGELDGEIKKSKLEFIVKTDENCTAIADGEKLSRVFENIIGNAAKYSLHGSRVYVSVKNVGNAVEIETKNISSYPMNFDGSEITERFVRGDSSRSTEGSGLGLAIAKSYTEACGGSFSIITDGDLFKCIIRLAKSM